jgi:hypothetical protein
MNFFYRFLIIIIVVGFTISVSGQNEGLRSISTDRLKSYLTFISSDSLQGRKFGTKVPGLDITANYLVLQAKKIGLNPGDSDFIQPVDIIYSQPDPLNTKLIIRNSKGKVVFETTFLVGLFSGGETNTFSGELVYAGFGWVDDKSGYNDFKGINVKDKIVVCSTGTPATFLEDTKGQAVEYNFRLEQAKLKRVLGMGAKGVILLTSSYDKRNNNFNGIKGRMNRGSYSLKNSEKENAAINFVLTPPGLYKVFFGKTGSLKKELLNRVKNKETEPFILNGFLAEITVARQVTEMQGKNIIGFVEGSDPELKKECVVFMAHYDHLGINSDGDVFNGADDNGSGTVTLLEVANAFMALEEKPKRSIVFLWVTGEEIGMFGSLYYAGHPLFPLENTLACINLDMVGRVFESRDTVWKSSPKMVKDFNGLYTLSGDNCPELVKISDDACKRLRLVPDKTLPPDFLHSSDHYSFYRKGVPILNYSTGYHADYHKVTDEISKINFDKMKKVAELCFLVGYEIANREERLVLNKPVFESK